KQALFLEQTGEHDFQLGSGVQGEFRAVHGAPGRKTLETGGEAANSSLLGAVGDDEDLVGGKESGKLLLVGLKLIPRRLNCRIGGGGAFEFENSDGQPVEENNDIRAAMMLAIDDGQLIDHKPVVVVWLFKVDEPSLVTTDPTL